MSFDSKFFDVLLEPVFILTEDKKILYCNESASLMCEISARKIQRQNPKLDEVFKFSETVQYLNQLNTLLDASGYQEIKFETNTGKQGKVQITIQPFDLYNEQPSYLVYFRDVTLEETLQKKYRAELEQKEGVIEDLKKAQSELQNYSENLEKMVEERTQEILKLNQTMKALLDSLSQGFFLFDKDGICSNFYSKATTSIIECQPAGRKIWDVFKISEKEQDGFQKWLMTVFEEMLPFEDLIPLGPQFFPHSLDKTIKLDYYPVRDDNQKIQNVVVVSSDITDLVAAQKEAEIERANAKMTMMLLNNKKQTHSFIRDSKSLIKDLNKYSQINIDFSNGTKFDSEDLFRILHTLKGGFATFSLKELTDCCHHAEGYLSIWLEDQLEKDLNLLTNCIHQIPLLFELFLKQNSKLIGRETQSNERLIELPISMFKNFSNRLPPQYKEDFTKEFFFEPIENYFLNYNEVIQQISEREGKKIMPHVIVNGNHKIIPEHYENLFMTLIHFYRNSIDHGIERPDVRLSNQKSEFGKICTEFSIIEQGQTLQIKITDDGAGIDPKRIKEKLFQKGISYETESDVDIIQHVFDSSFSTKDVATDLSGRGVGMDAILQETKKIGGKAWVESQIKKGTTLFIQVPYFKNLKEVTNTIQKASA